MLLVVTTRPSKFTSTGGEVPFCDAITRSRTGADDPAGATSTGLSSVCRAGGSASTSTEEIVRSEALSTPTTRASTPFSVLLSWAILSGVASRVLSSEVSTLPSRFPLATTASALTVIGEVWTARPSRFRSSAGTVRLRI